MNGLITDSMGLAIASAAKHKLIGLLSEKLRADEITVGEVIVVGLVKGIVWDPGSATIEARTVPHKFWRSTPRTIPESYRVVICPSASKEPWKSVTHLLGRPNRVASA